MHADAHARTHARARVCTTSTRAHVYTHIYDILLFANTVDVIHNDFLGITRVVTLHFNAYLTFPYSDFM